MRAHLHPDYRPDIDGLRAVAILAVVFYHAFPTVLSGGFVGVDVFFVISGFLISRIIFKSLNRGEFGFAHFYANRIRRIFPALLLMLVCSLVCGWFILLPDDYQLLGRHTLAGIGFVQNFVLLREAGYFDVASEMKPLMHLWSLAIEEQFYMLYPIMLVAFSRFRRKAILGMSLIILVSFSINIHDSNHDLVKAFFSPESRFWEMSLGGVLAWCSLRISSQETNHATARRRRKNAASCVGLVMVLFSAFFFDKLTAFPGWFAAFPVLGAVAMIYAGPLAIVNRHLLGHRVMIAVGLISYPLYLWHWPILAFVRAFESKAPSIEVRSAALVASFVLAWLTYRYLESALKTIRNKTRVAMVLCVVAVVTALVGLSIDLGAGIDMRAIARDKRAILQNLKWPFEVSTCAEKFRLRPCLSTGSEPTLLVLGDSHSNQLFPGLAAASELSFIAAGACAPFEGISIHVLKNQPRHPCSTVDTFAGGLQILSEAPSVSTVVLAGFWRPALSGQILNAREIDMWGGVRLESKYEKEGIDSNEEMVRAGLMRSISLLREKGLRVVLMRDTFDIPGELIEFCRLRDRAMPSDCTIPRADAMRRREPEDRLIASLVRKIPNLEIVDPMGILCDAERCFLMRNGDLYFRDQHHLSISGSKLIGSRILEALSLEGSTR